MRASGLRPKVPKSQSKRAAGCPAALIKSLREEAYFRLLIAVRSKDDAPAFFGQETRYGHRVYGGVLLNVGR